MKRTRSTPGRPLASIIAAVGLAAVAAPLAAALDQTAPKSTQVDVRTGVGAGRERLDIVDATARTSEASRINADLASKAGIVPDPTPGYRVTCTVIVRTSSPAVADAIRTNLGAAPIAGIPSFYRIDGATIAGAITIADALALTPGVDEAYLDVQRPLSLRSPTDPSYILQWHLRNIVTPGIDLGAEGAWDMGYSGAGTLVGIIEGGFEVAHPDLAPNYDAAASMSGGASTNHATSVAGLIAAAANNGKGGLGVAPGARISKLIYGTPATNADAFLWRNDIHAVKNNSWGPTDNGTVWPITSIEREALAATVYGRDGAGTIIVWAGGNGAYWESDRADYDPFASSRFAICVGAIDDDDNHAYYSEPGSCLLIVAHSSGGPGAGDRQIYTTTGGSAYTSTFGGTSTAAPLTAGVVALMLEANPLLSWRDVQHLLVDAARRCDPDSIGWTTNAAGRAVSYDYGFGAVWAPDAVDLATRWHTLPPERSAAASLSVNTPVPDGDSTPLERLVTIDQNFVVESVELKLNVATPFVGDLAVSLISPGGTESILTLPRDDAGDNYTNTVFTTRRAWGERAAGNWTVRIADPVPGDAATWQNLELVVHGFCPSDVNRDAELDILDFLDFIEAFGPCTGLRAPCYGVGGIGADYNRDGAVDVLDLLDFVDDLSGAC
jgi:subtilisin-like proprotein convertase family protein